MIYSSEIAKDFLCFLSHFIFSSLFIIGYGESVTLHNRVNLFGLILPVTNFASCLEQEIDMDQYFLSELISVFRI